MVAESRAEVLGKSSMTGATKGLGVDAESVAPVGVV